MLTFSGQAAWLVFIPLSRVADYATAKSPELGIGAVSANEKMKRVFREALALLSTGSAVIGTI